MAAKAAISCNGHRPYRSKADAQARIGWHPRCWKCRAGMVMNVFQCRLGGQHFHIGHRWP